MAFGIHSGDIDKGVQGILHGMTWCQGIWGYYEFTAPNSTYHITETKFNEPCYGLLRSIGKTRIHIHSFTAASEPAICVGTQARSGFLSNLQSALNKRGSSVVADYKGQGACARAPGTTGRDELGVEIQKDLAMNMATEAYRCGENTSLSTSVFGAFFEALCASFPNCCVGKSGGKTTKPTPGCGVGCDHGC
jgi:phage replication-related protein YjqB (UPF0714/DUF867 family)